MHLHGISVLACEPAAEAEFISFKVVVGAVRMLHPEPRSEHATPGFPRCFEWRSRLAFK
jgi:hypothetical protein